MLKNSKFSRPTTAKKVERPQKTSAKTSSAESDDIIQLMEQLIISQKQCEKSGKYVEAEGFKRKVKALQEEIDKRDIIEIKQRHERQRREIEEAHLEELNCFNIQWSEKMNELEASIVAMEQQLMKKHEEQTRLVQEQINEDKPYKFKESAQLLNLKKIEQQLAKQQNYMEAHQVQIRAQKTEKEQLEKFRKGQETKCKTNLNILKIKQENQLSALKQRIDLSFDQKRRQKELEQQGIILKYQNVLKQLDYQQRQEVMRYEKAVKLKGVQKKSKPSFGSTSKISIS